MRALASVRRIDSLTPIEGADAIECANIGGWEVVTQKNIHKEGDLVCYFEIDSFIPHSIAPFLSKGKTPSQYEGVEGERLRTIRLRGQISQGLLVPLRELGLEECQEDEDLTERLGILKWERPIPTNMGGAVKGNFPSLISKTDQPRIQNISRKFPMLRNETYEVTEKLEGSSMTVYLIDDVFGVCSRNLDLERNEDNSYWKAAIEANLEEKLRAYSNGRNIALQGELIGPGVQGDYYNIKSKLRFCVFDIFLETKYLLPKDRVNLCGSLGIDHVPILELDYTLPEKFKEVIQYADGISLINEKKQREGVVFKSNTSDKSFKSISNQYLIKN